MILTDINNCIIWSLVTVSPVVFGIKSFFFIHFWFEIFWANIATDLPHERFLGFYSSLLHLCADFSRAAIGKFSSPQFHPNLFPSLFLSVGFTGVLVLYFGCHVFPMYLNVSLLRYIASCRCSETWNGIIPPPSALRPRNSSLKCDVDQHLILFPSLEPVAGEAEELARKIGPQDALDTK